MNDFVWISTALGHPANMRPMQHSFSGSDAEREKAAAVRAANEAGEPLPAERFPREIFAAPHSKPSDLKLPCIFFAGSFWAVHQSSADILRQFDMGKGSLYPVEVYEKDRETAIPGPWFCINFGNRKDAFVPEESPKAMVRNIRPGGVKGWIPPFVPKDGDMVVSADALSGPDIWIDERVGDALFLSAALGNALRKAKADKGWMLKKCRVVAAN